MVADGRDRGQLILVGAIAIAFIVLGVVVVFNGVLYTQAISSGDSVESVTNVQTTELEVQRGVCGVIERLNEDGVNATDSEDRYHDNVEAFSDTYRNTTAQSRPALVHVEVDDVGVDKTATPHEAENITVDVTYDSSDLTYDRTIEISEDDCP
ncbi:hypothetical protein ACFOZ7_20785 [Natribaculum luteum]|uniref:Flagellin n=1 Tax=Natribaculum luteum TaxID=1586232 RepID=A0ABD5P4R9_9EURY|nr:hypothetical protein [Natribaculum luteum]